MSKLKIYHLFLTLLLMGATASLHAQSDVETVVRDVMQSERMQEFRSIDDRILYQPENATQVMNLLQPYYQDTIPKVRYRAYKIVHRIGKSSRDQDIKTGSVEALTTGLAEKDSGNAGAVMDFLTNYSREEFNDAAKRNLMLAVNTQRFHLDRLYKLAGFIHPENAISVIRQVLSGDTRINNKTKWAVYLALSRMGDEEALNEVMNRVRSLPVNDDFIYELAPDLIYTRQKPAIDYLVEILESDSPDCYSSDPDEERPILCGYRLIEYLTSAIEDYPYQLSSTGDLEAEDYEEALLEVRKWFEEKGERYGVRRDVY